MVDITANMVKELRERTGVGIMECKKVLMKTQGNIELAIDHMRKTGQTKAAKQTYRIATEGIIVLKFTPNHKYGVMIELNCETDFVAHASSFQDFGDKLVTGAIDNRISTITTLQNKFEQQRTQLVAQMKENITISRLSVLKSVGENNLIGGYLHRKNIGVLVSATNANVTFIKKIAMHITASKPEYLYEQDITDEVLAREYQIQLDIAMKSGKSPAIAEKMIQGRMSKFTKEISLIGQYFIMDPTKTIGQLLAEQNVQINSFVRFAVGEKIKHNKH